MRCVRMPPPKRCAAICDACACLFIAAVRAFSLPPCRSRAADATLRQMPRRHCASAGFHYAFRQPADVAAACAARRRWRYVYARCRMDARRAITLPTLRRCFSPLIAVTSDSRQLSRQPPLPATTPQRVRAIQRRYCRVAASPLMTPFLFRLPYISLSAAAVIEFFAILSPPASACALFDARYYARSAMRRHAADFRH